MGEAEVREGGRLGDLGDSCEDFGWGTLAAFGSPLGWEVRRDQWGGLRERREADKV